MAVALDPKQVLRSTDGTENFHRLTRLLTGGGASLFREIFDAFCPPSQLPRKLNMPTTKSLLKAAKLTKPQWDCLYLSPGVYGKSTDFDVTLLFRLLRSICGLTPPATGWDALPVSTDHSVTADLVRIKYYRNSIYGHKQDMEISNEEFVRLWQEVSEALVRLAKSISTEKETQWIEAINDFLTDPLTENDNRNVQELERWYTNDMEVKTYVQELKLGMDRLEKTVKETPHPIKEALQEISQGIKDLQKVQEEIIGRQFSTQVRFPRDKSRSLSHCSQLTGALLRMLIDCETTDSNTRTQEVTKINKSLQEPQTVPEQVASIPFGVCSSRSQGPQTEIDTNNLLIEGERKGGIPLTEDMLNVIAFNYRFQHAGPSEVEETEGVYRKYLENVREIDSQIQSFRLTITLECGTLQFLEELWSDYLKGHLNEMVRTLLVTEGIVKDFGLVTVKLNTTIMDEEYWACREYFLNRPEGCCKVAEEASQREGEGDKGKEGDEYTNDVFEEDLYTEEEKEQEIENRKRGEKENQIIKEVNTAFKGAQVEKHEKEEKEKGEEDRCIEKEEEISENCSEFDWKEERDERNETQEGSEIDENVEKEKKALNERKLFNDYKEEIEEVFKGVAAEERKEESNVEEVIQKGFLDKEEDEIEEVLDGVSEDEQGERSKVKNLNQKEFLDKEEDEIEEVLEGASEDEHGERSKVEKLNQKEFLDKAEDEIEEVLEGISEEEPRERSKVEKLNQKEFLDEEEEEIEEVLEGASEEQQSERSKAEKPNQKEFLNKEEYEFEEVLNDCPEAERRRKIVEELNEKEAREEETDIFFNKGLEEESEEEEEEEDDDVDNDDEDGDDEDIDSDTHDDDDDDYDDDDSDDDDDDDGDDDEQQEEEDREEEKKKRNKEREQNSMTIP